MYARMNKDEGVLITLIQLLHGYPNFRKNKNKNKKRNPCSSKIIINNSEANKIKQSSNFFFCLLTSECASVILSNLKINMLYNQIIV